MSQRLTDRFSGEPFRIRDVEFNDPQIGVRSAPTRKILGHGLLPLFRIGAAADQPVAARIIRNALEQALRSEEHTSELQSLMRISYAVFCLKKKKKQKNPSHHTIYPTYTIQNSNTRQNSKLTHIWLYNS